MKSHTLLFIGRESLKDLFFVRLQRFLLVLAFSVVLSLLVSMPDVFFRVAMSLVIITSFGFFFFMWFITAKPEKVFPPLFRIFRSLTDDQQRTLERLLIEKEELLELTQIALGMDDPARKAELEELVLRKLERLEAGTSAFEADAKKFQRAYCQWRDLEAEVSRFNEDRERRLAAKERSLFAKT